MPCANYMYAVRISGRFRSVTTRTVVKQSKPYPPMAEALEAAAMWQDIYGKDNFFLELMDHGLDIEKRTRDGLLEIGRQP